MDEQTYMADSDRHLSRKTSTVVAKRKRQVTACVEAERSWQQDQFVCANRKKEQAIHRMEMFRERRETGTYS